MVLYGCVFGVAVCVDGWLFVCVIRCKVACVCVWLDVCLCVRVRVFVY